MKTRNDELQDLFYAVKRYLVKNGRSQQAAITVATNVLIKVEKNNESIETIRSLRDVFI